MPTPEDVRQKLIEAIQTVQRDSGMPEPVLTGKSCPTLEIDGFDSPLWIVVTGIVAIGLGVEIPPDINVFVDEDGEKRLTIDESVAVICKTMVPAKDAQ